MHFTACVGRPLPNLAEDLIVPPLAQVMPLDVASKLFLVAIFALIAGGAIWLNRVASGGWRLWPLLCVPAAIQPRFLMGLYQLPLRDRRRARRRSVVAGARTGALVAQSALHRRSWRWRAYSAISPPSAFTRW